MTNDNDNDNDNDSDNDKERQRQRQRQREGTADVNSGLVGYWDNNADWFVDRYSL